MSIKKGLFSWFSKKPAKKTEQEEKEQAELLAREQAELEASEKDTAEEVKRQAELAERELAEKQQVELLARKQAELEAQEIAAAEEAKRQAELVEKERAEKQQAELLARKQAELEAQEIAAAEEAELVEKERAEKEQAELLARKQAELEAQQIAAAEEAKRQAELVEKHQAELAEKERAEKEQAELLERELAVKRAELLARKQAELEAREKAAAEEAQRQAEIVAQQEAAAKARLAYQEAQKNAELARQQVESEANEEAVQEAEIEAKLVAEEEVEAEKQKNTLGFFARFAAGLKKTRLNIGSGLLSLFKGKKIDDELFEELEEQLIVADIGVETTLRIIDNLTEHANRKQLKDAEVLYELLKKDLSDILHEVEKPLVIDVTKKPYVILMVGVNGVGKTTTIGKLAKKFQNEGKSVMLAAGDTFRAAAVEQLQVWGERNEIPVIAQQTGADSASVLFDAMDAAQARGIDVLIADTAGRLQNKDHLMDELAKVVRIMRKKDPTAPHEIMLTIDAGTGQNAISQVKLFNQAVGLTGVTFTKLDGTAKGGIIFSIADQFKLPIRYIGVGEGIDDLREFNAKEFIDALFSKEDES
ncbi:MULTISPECIES: signal recognition particle-docking protein FtsY [Psychromonas]|uniref:signal recognition particle-docking protein FtsY n=1 Tax=Psychromonas TaxID=67572 RepID=UPI0003FB2813|nr:MULTISPECIES: signal recognition particle-docking protein FtsY [Psychromonas]MBB1272616.1 signal recognition particle-docking protein FtsY [Psychromonas sp. SR45-3]